MPKLDLGQAFNTLANVGVLAGIVFLAFEIRQTQELARAEIRNEIYRAFQDSQQAIIDGPLAEVMLKVQSGQELAELEQLRFRTWVTLSLTQLENLNYQHSQGLFDSNAFESEFGGFMVFLNRSPLAKSAFCSGRMSRDPSFVAQVDSRLSAPCE